MKKDQDGLVVIDMSAPAAGDSDVLVLREDLDLDLPRGATLNDDNTVTLTFDRPLTLRIAARPGAAPAEETFDHFVLRRLLGPDMRKVLASKNGTDVALALSAGISQAKLALLRTKLDAAEITAAIGVVSELMAMGEGLPARAVAQPDGSYILPLIFPVDDEEGEVTELHMRRYTGADLTAVRHTEGVETLLVLLARGTGRTPKQMGTLFDLMDAADINSAQRVAGFLSGSGRKTGR